MISNEFLNVDFSDERLNERFYKIAESFMKYPGSRIMESFDTIKEAKAAYRFLSNPKVSTEIIQKSHRDAINQRCLDVKELFAIQDTCYINFSHHGESKKDICELSSADRIHKLPGVVLHNTLLTNELGVPIGIYDHQTINRQELREKDVGPCVPIQEKESYRWIEATETLKGNLPEKLKVTIIGDREADIFKLLSFIQDIEYNFVVRVCYDRRIADSSPDEEEILLKKLYEKLKETDWNGHFELEIYDQKTKKNRTANFKIKYTEVYIRAPSYVTRTLKGMIKATVIEINEVNGQKINWKIITNRKVESVEDGIEIVKLYKRRWVIEEYHKILKSGCKIESCRLETFSRIQNYLGIVSVVAVKLLTLTKYSRSNPDLPCEVILEKTEWQALVLMTSERPNLTKIPTLKEATLLIARLGGFLGRKGDGNPGVQIMWRGWKRLENYHEVFLKLKDVGKS